MRRAPSLAATARSANLIRGPSSRPTASPLTERACALSVEDSLLEITEMRDAGSVRLRLRGELDLASAPALADRLDELRDRHADVVLDLDELAFIDMSGLRVALSAAEEASRDGRSFAVTHGSPAVRRLVELVQLDGQLPLDGSTR